MLLYTHSSLKWKGVLPLSLRLGSRDQVNNDGGGGRFQASPGELSSAHSEGNVSLNSEGLQGWAWVQNSLHSSSLGRVIAKTRVSFCLGFNWKLVCPVGSSYLGPKFGEQILAQEGNQAVR